MLLTEEAASSDGAGEAPLLLVAEAVSPAIRNEGVGFFGMD